MKKLPDICRIQYGFAFDSALFSDSEGKPLIRIRDVLRGYSETYTTEKCSADYIVQNGDMLIGMDGEFNIQKWRGGEALLNQRVCRIIPNEDIIPDYLFYFMPTALKHIEEKTAFVTVKHLSAKALNAILVPVPSLDKQRYIALVLNTVSNLISLRKQQLAKLDELVKVRFVEMFGDPVENPMGWETQQLGELLTVPPQNGLYKPQNDYVSDGSGTPILRIDAFYNGKVTSFGRLKRLVISDEEKGRFCLKENDIVINRVNSIEYLGKCAHITGLVEDTVYESNMMRFHLLDSVADSGFVTHLLCTDYIYNQIIRRAKKAVNQASINQGDVKSLQLLLPPIEMQKQFTSFARNAESKKAIFLHSLNTLQTLKSSLMQQYFG